MRLRSPAARRRRRRARAPSPARPCRRRSSGAETGAAAGRQRGSSPCSRRPCSATTARPSTCARVVRGIDSIANATTPRAASRSIPSGSLSGARNPISTVPGSSSATSSAVGRPTRTTAPAPASSSARETTSAPAAAYSSSVKPRGEAGVALDRERESRRGELADSVGDERDPALAGAGLFRDCDPHEDRTLRRSADGEEGNRRPLWKVGHCGITARYLLGGARGAGSISPRPLGPGHLDRRRPGAETRLARRAARRAPARRLAPRRRQDRRRPRSVLCKPGPLTAEELAQIRTHPIAGARLIEAVPDFRPALPYVLHHHERWDGAGYPAPPRGRGDPDRSAPARGRGRVRRDDVGARVPARSLRRAGARRAQRCAGSQFDPELAETFVEGWRTGEIAVRRIAGRRRRSSEV